MTMKESSGREYEARRMSAEEAIRLVRNGDRIYTGTSSSVAYALDEALFMGPEERKGLPEGITDYTSFHLSQLDLWIRERVRALISIAHPDHRKELEEDAKKMGLL